MNKLSPDEKAALKTAHTLPIGNRRNHASNEGATPLRHRRLVQALGPDYFPMPVKTPRYHRRIIGEDGTELFRRNTPIRKPKKTNLKKKRRRRVIIEE